MLAQYDAKQLYYMQYSNRGEKFDLAADRRSPSTTSISAEA